MGWKGVNGLIQIGIEYNRYFGDFLIGLSPSSTERVRLLFCCITNFWQALFWFTLPYEFYMKSEIREKAQQGFRGTLRKLGTLKHNL